MEVKNFRAIKPEIRVLGVDDGKFIPHTKDNVIVVGAVFRGGYWLEGVIHTYIAIDGLDATGQIASMITGSPHSKQLRLIMLNGITFAGFNVVDIKRLNLATNLPVIALTHDKPDLDGIHKALNNLSQNEARWKMVLEAGEIYEVLCKGVTRIYIEIAGISKTDAQKIIKLTSTRSSFPEPLRIAHLIASGIS